MIARMLARAGILGLLLLPLLLPRWVLIVVDRDDRVGALNLVLELVVPGGDVLRQHLLAPHLPRLIRRLAALDLSPLRHIPRKWVDGGHAIFFIGYLLAVVQ